MATDGAVVRNIKRRVWWLRQWVHFMRYKARRYGALAPFRYIIRRMLRKKWRVTILYNEDTNHYFVDGKWKPIHHDQAS